MVKLDKFDMNIIALLQENGRLSNLEVADKVGLSHSSCSRRINRLEREQVITGYRAQTNRPKLGLSFRAFCNIYLSTGSDWQATANAIAELEGVVSVFAVSGEADLMVEIITKDIEHFSQAIMQNLLNVEGVSSSHSYIVLSEIKSLL